MSRHRTSRFLPPVVALAFAAAWLGAEGQKPLVFGTGVSVVAIPVFVTDQDGRSVPGLTAADFEIEDAGKLVPVAAFQAISGDSPAVFPEGASAVTEASARRQFVLVFDLDFSRSSGVERASKAARDFLATGVQSGDLVAVATGSKTGVKLLVGLTSDRSQALRAIESMGRAEGNRQRDPLGILFDASLEQELSSRTAEGLGRDPDFYKDQALSMARTERQIYTQRVQQFVTGLMGLGRVLDGVKGRKQLVLFSEGFDSTIVQGLQGEQRTDAATSVTSGKLWEVDPDQYFGSPEGRSAFGDLFATMRSSDVVVHTVDLMGGVDTMNLQSQERDSTSYAFKGGADSMAEMARNTGGRFVRGSTDIAASLREISDSTKDYYVLAFTPTSSKDPSQPRKLKIKVKRAGLSVSHRPVYRLPDPKKRDGNRIAMESAEIISKGLSGGKLRVDAALLPYRSKASGPSLSMVVQIGPDAFKEALTRTVVGLEVFGYLLAADGSVKDHFSATPSLDPKLLGEKLKLSGLQFLTTMAAGEGPYEIRILVRDPVSGAWGALRKGFTMPSFGPTVASLSPPLFLDDPFARVALPVTTSQRPNLEIPFRIGDRPFTLEGAPILKQGEAREVCVFVFGRAGGLNPPLQVVLAGPDGGERALTVSDLAAVRDADGFERWVFKLSPGDAPAGEYVLSARLADKPAVSGSVSVRVQ